jgi:hypothetical protein
MLRVNSAYGGETDGYISMPSTSRRRLSVLPISEDTAARRLNITGPVFRPVLCREPPALLLKPQPLTPHRNRTNPNTHTVALNPSTNIHNIQNPRPASVNPRLDPGAPAATHSPYE